MKFNLELMVVAAYNIFTNVFSHVLSRVFGLVLVMLCFTIVESHNQLLWKQAAPNAPYSQLPVALQMGKESIADLSSPELLIAYTTKLREEDILFKENKELDHM